MRAAPTTGVSCRVRYLLHHLLAEATEIWPDREALRCAGRSVTYGELEAASNGVAAALVDAGVRPGDRVGVLLPKGPEAVVAFAAASKAGAVFVPIDPLAPTPLASDVARDAGIVSLVAAPRHAADLAEAGAPDLRAVVTVENPLGESGSGAEPPARIRRIAFRDAASSGAADPGIRRSEVDLCCIAYTSGSTGTPKGVMATHRAFLAAADWFDWQMGVTERDRLGVHPPLQFLLSAYTLWGAIHAGACAVLIAEEEARWGSELVRVIREERIGVWFSVTAALSQILRAGARPEDVASLRAIGFGGAPTAASDVQGFLDLFRGATLVHIMGTSESWHNSCHPFTAAPPDGAGLPLGGPPANVETMVLTEDGRRAGPGEQGELFVRSPCLMRGYWNRPDLTAEVLVPDPLDPLHGGRMHRTGDMMLVRDDGLLEFVGRRDLMVKTRGNRVEPEHVERVIVGHSFVDEAVVVAIPHASWGSALAAQVVPTAGRSLTPAAVREFVAARLPGYMVPSAIAIVDALPRTSAGKIDRVRVRTTMSASLPDPTPDQNPMISPIAGTHA